jgi:hypothetical protein
MNLKKQYQRLFEGRQAFAKVNTLKTGDSLLEAPMSRAFPRMRTAAEKQAAGVVDRQYPEGPEPFDIEYYSDQINTLLTSIDEFHQELGTNIEMKADETGDYQYETAEKQISRYINSSQKGLEDLQKYLERQKGNL